MNCAEHPAFAQETASYAGKVESTTAYLLPEVETRISQHNERASMLVCDLEDLADRIFGPTPSSGEAAGPPNPQSGNAVGRLSDILDRTHRIDNRLEDVLQRLRQLA